MQVLKVGGCVRDSIMGLVPNDIDYVVVGSSPKEMLDRGFHVVGHFPVFLHPDTGDEYALARYEVSTGPGHSDFAYEWRGVTLLQDQERRDLTINSMAESDDGVIFDPFNGRADIESKTLRHVSMAFADDPLRVLRVARFSAQLGFTVAPETLELMKSITAAGKLSTIKSERLWAETKKALLTKDPSRYFQVLGECGALEILMPEISSLRGIPQRDDYHAEGDAYVHTMMVLDEAVASTDRLDLPEDRKLRIRMAALLHDLGKAKTKYSDLWAADGSIIGRHPGHESEDVVVPLINAFKSRLSVPSAYSSFALIIARHHQSFHTIKKMGPKGLVGLYTKLGIDKRDRRPGTPFFEDLLLSVEADNYGRRTRSPSGEALRPVDYQPGHYVTAVLGEIAKVDTGAIMRESISNAQPIEKGIEKVYQARIAAAKLFLRSTERDVGPMRSLE